MHRATKAEMDEIRLPEALRNADAMETFAFSRAIFIAWYSSHHYGSFYLLRAIIPDRSLSLAHVPFGCRLYLISVFGH